MLPNSVTSCILCVVVDDTTELKLLEVIGQGNFGTVYSAAWQGSVIAAKVIPVHMAEAASVTRELEIVQ